MCLRVGICSVFITSEYIEGFSHVSVRLSSRGAGEGGQERPAERDHHARHVLRQHAGGGPADRARRVRRQPAGPLHGERSVSTHFSYVYSLYTGRYTVKHSPLPRTQSLATPEAVPVNGRVRNLKVCGHVNTFQEG